MLLVGSQIVRGGGIIPFCQFLILFAGKHIHILDFGKKDEFLLSANGDKYLN